eukprot:6581866-Ditylum_brightwellii.AAC.1
MKVLVERGPDREYFPEPEKSIHVCDDPSQVEEMQAIFAEEGLQIIIKDGQRYVGGFVGTEETRLEWVQPQIEQWGKGVKTLATFSLMYPQTAYAGLVMSLQAEWQYLQRTVPG